ncbi:MAG TPA: porin [Azospirillaceae bacterium]|nr:porin [Azospirillaceae bacterium]
MTRSLPLAALLLGLNATTALAEVPLTFAGEGQLAGAWSNKPAEDRWSAYAAYQLEATAERTSDSGLIYGATVKLGSGDYEEGSGPGINAKFTVNEWYLFLESAYGRVRVGDEDGAADRALLLLPIIGAGQMEGFWTEAAGVAPPSGYLGRDSDDATKIFYETPEALPVTLGVSYAPERESLFEDIEEPSEIAPEKHFLELAASWRGESGPVTYELGAAWKRAEARRPFLRDTNGYSVAGVASYGGFQLGAVWFDDGRSGRFKGAPGGDTQGTTVQGTYENGPYGLTLFRHDSEVEGTLDYAATGIGLAWRVRPEVTLGLDLVRWEAERARTQGGGRDDGLVGLLAVQAEF